MPGPTEVGTRYTLLELVIGFSAKEARAAMLYSLPREVDRANWHILALA